MTQDRNIGRVIRSLRERKVFRAALLYAAAAWVVAQVAALVLAAYEAPPWALRAVITLLLIGFPLTLFLSWLYELTPRGLERETGTQPRCHRWLQIAGAATAIALSAGAIWLVWTGYTSEARLAESMQQAQQPALTRPVLTRPVPKTLPVVAVAPLRNLSGEDSLDWIGEGLANLVRDGLTESRHLVVVSPLRWDAVARASGVDSATLLQSANEAGIDYLVSGEFLSAPEGLVLTARVTDVAAGIELSPQRLDRLDERSLLGAASTLVLLAKRALNVPHTERIEAYAADFAVDNIAAYEAYLGGLGYFLDFDYRKAEQGFTAALKLAPGFHMARYRLAHVQAATGRTQEALATLAKIPANAPLTLREKAYVEGARALFARDAKQAKAIYTRLLQQLPYDVEARQLLALAHDLDYDDEAALRELRALARQEPENDRLWSYMGETLLRMGRYDEAREALERYLALEPRDPFGFTVLGRLEQANGKLDDAARHLVHALELEPDFTLARLALAQTRALEGKPAEAERELRALVGDERAPPGHRIDAAFDLAGLLSGQGRFAEAAAPLTQLEPLIREEGVREAMSFSVRALAATERGRFAEAQQLVDRAVKASPGAPTRYLFAAGLLALARGEHAAIARIAGEIRTHALPASESDRTEDKAADYLEGMGALATRDVPRALDSLQRAVAREGYQYALYKLGLARAKAAAGRDEEALRLVREASAERDPGDPRLDLELERTRALLLEAEILDRRGDARRAAQAAKRFLERWRAENPDDREAFAARAISARA